MNLRRAIGILLSAAAVCVLAAPPATRAQSSSAAQKKPPVQSPAGSQQLRVQSPTGSQQPPPVPFQQGPPAPHRDLAGRLRVAAAIVRENPQSAVQMLRGLDREYPRNSEVLGYLGDAYQVMGEIDSALAVYGRALSANPADARAGASLGTLYVQKGEREKGEQIFRGVIARSQPSLSAYRAIGSTLAAAGFNDLALRWYDEGRGANNGHYIFTLDIAQLHRQMGDFEKSLDEYLRLIETTPQQVPLAQDRILELLRDPRADDKTLLGRLAAASSRATAMS